MCLFVEPGSCAAAGSSEAGAIVETVVELAVFVDVVVSAAALLPAVTSGLVLSTLC